MSNLTIFDAIKDQATRSPEALAILGLDGEPLTYRRLQEQIEQGVAALHRLGISRQTRVGLVVEQGPEMAVALLTVWACATAVPYSPTLPAEEFQRFMGLANVSHMIIQAGISTDARLAAERMKIPIIDLVPEPGGEVGLFALRGEPVAMPAPAAHAHPDDAAVVMLSSGTTGRPKIIPRLQRDLIEAVLVANHVFRFGPTDRVLNVLSMVFTGGQAEFIRILVAGGSVICTPGLRPQQFFAWLEQFRPTLLTATANHFKSILSYAAANPDHLDHLDKHCLRYLRSTAMAIPADLVDALEQTFRVPVIQNYGSTEVGSITSNPLPPGIRKRDSVGPAVGGEVAIFGPENERLGPHEVGEVWVRGLPMLRGYENDPALNAASFVDGWFRTGDQGYLDEDQYLFITGRLKELINRAGEKISPQDIELVLRQYPGVAEVAVFAVPDPDLGEDIGAAIVTTADATVEPAALRQFVAERLPSSRIPRYVTLMDTLPRTVTGKIKRATLAALYTPRTYEPLFAAPRTELERQLTLLWAEVLQIPAQSIGLNVPFRSIGGDSLTAARLIFRIHDTLRIMVRLADFVDAPTVAEQAQVLERLSTGAPGDQPKTTVVPLRAHGSRVPLFCLHAINGGVYFYQALLPLLHPAQPVYGIQAVGMDGTEAPLNCMQDIAARQADEIRCIQAHGPYLLCGYSAGGRFAMETARVLMDTYHETVHVLIIDDHLGVNGAELARQHAMRQAGPLPRAWMRLQSLTFALLRLPMRYKRRYLYETIARKSSTPERRAQRLLSHQALERQEALMPPALLRVRQGLQDAIKTYEVRPYRGTLKYLRANDDDINIPFFRTCEKVGLSAAAIIDIPGTHATLMKPPYVEHVAEQLNEWLQASLIGSVDAASGNYRGLTPP